MKSMAVLLNAPNLGGAERSIILQSKKLIGKYALTYYIPSLSTLDSHAGREHSPIRKFIQDEVPSAQIKDFIYPKALYEISRKSNQLKLLEVLIAFLNALLIFRKANLIRYDCIWANGNKIAFISYLYLRLFLYRNKFIWHFRDYPFNKGFYVFLWKLINSPFLRNFELLFIGNSQSVCREIKTIFPREKIIKLYNPVGILPKVNSKREEKYLGVLSMFAPWKGIHQVIWCCLVYEKKLRELGYSGLKIFGGDIYQTRGEHQGYAEQLYSLCNKYNSGFIEFCGLKSPHVALSEIDVLVHPSLRAEPFGRVIVEAFKEKIPVISTGLGGAGEIIQNNINGLIFYPYDYIGLVEQIGKFTKDKLLRDALLDNAYKTYQTIEVGIDEALQKYF